MTHIYTTQMLRNLALSATALVALAACGGGASTEQNDEGNTGPRGSDTAYPATSPRWETDDVNAFRIHVWERFHDADTGCAGCHASGTSRNFATTADINRAYRLVLGTDEGMDPTTQSLINFADVSQSRLVTFVRGGHSCWLTSTDPSVNSADLCANQIETWIRNWRATQSGTQINLQAPPMADPVSSRAWPADGIDGNPSYRDTVYQLVGVYCSNCHSPNAATRQQPYIGSSDVNQSYEAARPRMNLDVPSLSRLVERLREESHNCWAPTVGMPVNCEANALAMEEAIADFAEGIDADPIPSEWVTSRALGMLDGTLATGGSRYDEAIVAKYEFKEGGGARALDTSNVQPLMHLDLYDTPTNDGVEFAPGWGLQFAGGRAQAQSGPSTKLRSTIGLTGEYSIEVWAAPANVVQDNARRIVTYSGNAVAGARNFTLGQSLYNYNALSSSGMLSTLDADRRAQASLQHVVVTFSVSDGRRIYVNGVFTNATDSGGAAISQWADTYAFAIGNEVGALDGATAWHGTLRFVAIHNRALTPEQVRQNFDVGIGEKYFVLFSVGHLIDVPRSYVMFTVTRYDGYSYLFDKPTFISLPEEGQPDAMPDDLVIRGMRIGVNGREPTVGQAYSKLNVVVTNDMYLPSTGASLSSVGTIIPLEYGPGRGTVGDQFFLTFEQIGDEENVRTEPVPATPALPADVPRPSQIGVRTFDAINETFSQITGVNKNTLTVRTNYLTVKQALPAAETFQAFLASHQTAVAQLAAVYCSEMVNSNGLNVGARDRFYNTVIDMNSPLGAGSYAAIIDPVIDNVMGVNLFSQPDRTAVRDELFLLLNNTDTELNNTDGDAATYRALGLCAGPGGCDSTRRALAMKAVCAAGLASAVTTVQ